MSQNLLDIVDLADECGTNPYWRMNDTDRDLFSKYAEQKLNQRPRSIPEDKPLQDSKHDSASVQPSDKDIADDDHVDNADDDDENDGSGSLHTGVAETVLCGDGEVSDATPKNSGRVKSKRWTEYCKLAKDHLFEANGTKPSTKETYALSRQWLQEDGWM